MPLKLNSAIADVLLPAYAPCPEFGRACTEMRWQPKTGHVPRGFLGASGALNEVELVLVFAEPGDPQEGESHTGLESAYEYATFSFETGKDQFHRNVRHVLDSCWPELSFEQQMHKVWLTDSVLCSARKECGPVSAGASRACGNRYLRAQLELFPGALVAALGGKAQERLRALGFTSFISAYAAAPPGCNRREAQASWDQIPLELRRLRSLVATHPESNDEPGEKERATNSSSNKLLVAFEGGTVHTDERDGKFLVVINQVALLDLLDAEDRAGIEGIKVLAFPDAASRHEYIVSRGWNKES